MNVHFPEYDKYANPNFLYGLYSNELADPHMRLSEGFSPRSY